MVVGAKAEVKKKKAKETEKVVAPAVSFAKADKNRDGAVTLSEYVATMKSSIGEEAAGLRFGSLDRNYDGKLIPAEYNVPLEPESKKKGKIK